LKRGIKDGDKKQCHM